MVEASKRTTRYEPLAAKVRPATLEEFVGQQHLLGENGPLRCAIDDGVLHSMILWGPPGTGKTTLARLLAGKMEANLELLSAVLAGVKEVRAIVERARSCSNTNSVRHCFLWMRYIVSIRHSRTRFCLIWRMVL